MTEYELLKTQVAALQRRVKQLEMNVRPLATLQGVDGNLLADQAVVSFVADSLGTHLATITGPSRVREVSALRRRAAALLHDRVQWTTSRIARNLGCSEAGVRRMLGKSATSAA